MKYVFSVAKTYKHRGKHHHQASTKKYWFIYYCDEEGKFHSKQVSYVMAMYYKQNKFHRKKCYCITCDRIFVALVKSTELGLCPLCGE